MAVFKIHNLEKQSENSIIFPEFNLEISEGQSVSIYSNTNVRNTLLKMMVGKAEIINGEIIVNQQKIPKPDMSYNPQVGFSFLNEALYERLTIKDHFKFYKKLYGSNQWMEDMLHTVQLSALRHEVVRNLSYSKKRRVHMARLLFQAPSLFVFEEPDQNVDVETRRVLLKQFKALQQNGKSILILTENMESAITLTDYVYRLDEKGLHSIELERASQHKVSDKEEQPLEKESMQPIRFNKIPTKMNEKMVLFDPQEIDYIESHAGQSHIYCMGESFTCAFTLAELEERLQPYGFFRCHRSYIVNLQQVKEVVTWTRNSYSLILVDKKESVIPLSKTKMAELKVMLGIK